MNIETFLQGNYPYHAHLRPSHQETLKEHSDLTYAYYERLKSKTNSKRLIEMYLTECRIENRAVFEFVEVLFDHAIYLHDIGKINRYFQIMKMKNHAFGTNESGDSHHSIYSALIYLHIFMNQLDSNCFNKLEIKTLKRLWVRFAYIISRHHGYLRDLNAFYEAIETALKTITDDKSIIVGYRGSKDLTDPNTQKKLRNFVKLSLKLEETSQPEGDLILWMLCKDLYASIVTCDFYATGEYMSERAVESFGEIDDVHIFTSKYFGNELIDQIKMYDVSLNLEPINHLRSQMFLEAERNFIKRKCESVFYLEAPTGCGKTLASINLAVTALLNAPNINRIFYVFPFNTLVEQTYETLKSLFDESYMAVVNSIESIKTDDSEDYNKMYLDRIMLHYPITVTSHVNFFSALTGSSREAHLIFSHFRNSVVIIDEIQSYKNMIWQELVEIIHLAAEVYNIKFIIMSATLPKITNLTNQSSVMLIENPKDYFENPLFKHRTRADFSLLDKGKITLDELCISVCSRISAGGERILVEFIDKLSARAFYQILCDKNPDESYEIVELTGDDHNLYRKKLIRRLKEPDSEGGFKLKQVVVIATQVIEAGVDIDMNIGYKDISLIDSEEQFAGRINRSCKLKDAPIYFFDYFDEKKIYSNDVRQRFNLRQEWSRKWFVDKNYRAYFDAVLKALDEERQKFNKNYIGIYRQLISQLAFSEIFGHLKLIDQESITIFIPQIIEDEGSVIDGTEIWNEYVKLGQNFDMPFTRKQVELSRLKKTFSYFTYNVKYPPIAGYCDESMNKNLYLLLENQYIVNGKFDRQAYNDANGRGNIKPEYLIL